MTAAPDGPTCGWERRLFGTSCRGPGAASTIPPGWHPKRPLRITGSQDVFSLVGVLAITLALFLVVAITARLILGR